MSYTSFNSYLHPVASFLQKVPFQSNCLNPYRAPSRLFKISTSEVHLRRLSRKLNNRWAQKVFPCWWKSPLVWRPSLFFILLKKKKNSFFKLFSQGVLSLNSSTGYIPTWVFLFLVFVLSF